MNILENVTVTKICRDFVFETILLFYTDQMFLIKIEKKTSLFERTVDRKVVLISSHFLKKKVWNLLHFCFRMHSLCFSTIVRTFLKFTWVIVPNSPYI